MSEAYSELNSVEAEEMQTLKENKVIQKEYVLPPATATTLGGVKIGEGINIDENGTISTANIVLGSKYYANDWSEGAIVADLVSSGTVDFLINENYPENRIITDILVHINEGGTVEQYSFARLYSNGELGGISAPFICSKPELNSGYSLYTVAFISNLSTASSNFYSRLSVSDTAIEGFTVKYIEI